MDNLTIPALVLMVVFVGTGLLKIKLALPLIRRQVKPNALYGFRARKTLSDERIWYEANAYAAKLLLRLAAATIATAVFLFGALYWAGFSGQNFLIYVGTCLLVQLGGIVICLMRSFRYLRSL